MTLLTQRLKDMFEMQEALNAYTNGADYKETKSCAKTGKAINYRRCAWMETAEFIGSFDWKHWKHGKDDIENAKTELVDIWHFLMSAELIEKGMPDDSDLEYAHKSISSNPYSNDMFAVADIFVCGIIEEPSILPNEEAEGVLSDFLLLCTMVGLSFDELYKRYVIKNSLNFFRQDHGYAEGTYIKNWSEGKEDNVFAIEFADKLGENLSKTTLYELLKDFYCKSVVNQY
jgi:dimeric dUTPase (all-alpha-NTP-PPase superfamily)